MKNLGPESPRTFRTPTLTKGIAPAARAAAARQVEGGQGGQKERRFHVDPVLRDLLSVDEEAESEINRRVAAKVAEIRAQAEEEGRDRGYEEGYQRGKAEAKTVVEAASNERLERFDVFLSTMESLKDEIYRANERFLVELVFRIASNVLQRELATDREYMTRIVRGIVEKVGVKEQLKLIASEEQVEGLYALLPELQKKHAGLRNISVEPSSQLGDFDVVLETDFNRVDATLASQMEMLHSALVEELGSTHASEAAAGSEGDGEPESA
jgi:flagellar assembly protein FliH